MLKVYDQNHDQLGMLTRYKNPKIESDLSTGDKKFTFSVTGYPDVRIRPEYHLRDRKDEYLVKRIEFNSRREDVQYECVLNLDPLDGVYHRKFTFSQKTIEEAMELALDGTGWTLGTVTVDANSRHNFGKIDCDVLSIIRDFCTIWFAEPEFDTVNKMVHLWAHRGEDKGCYFATGFNMKKLVRREDSYDLYTRIRPVGADSLLLPEGYLADNDAYGINKVREYLWVDESYTDASTLREDAAKMLEEMSKPKVEITCEVIDLAKQSSQYSILSYGLGDEVVLIDPGTRTRDKQRIIKMVEYPFSPWKNECQMSNKEPRFTELLQQRKNAESIEVYETENGTLTDTVSLSQILQSLKS